MIYAENRRARFDYEFLDEFEAGLCLQGWEVKSLRAKQGNLRASWISFRDGEAFLLGCSISRWKFSNDVQDKERPKKLLLHKKQVQKLEQRSHEKGISVIPIDIHTNGKQIKCRIAVARGRKKYDKKQVLKDRTTKKEAQKALKHFN